MNMCKVNRFLLQPNIFYQNLLKTFCKYTHDNQCQSKVLYPLKGRALIKVTGNHAAEFLQGLITNDMNHLEKRALSMYAMFLNNKGRVLFDTLIHKWGDENMFMIECDQNVHGLLQKHLNIYKLKRDIQIRDINKLFNIWAFITPPDAEVDHGIDIQCNINVYKDPRLPKLGYRLITTTSVDNFDLHDVLGKDIVIEKDEKGYQSLKYRLGVAEGAEELFPGTCLPLEANCDYLHGVSFHKGCYIGQELTARVHHTGVVRKRIMPLKFKKEIKQELPKDIPIWAETNSGKNNIGKLKSYAHGFGLGLVRIKEALAATALSIGPYPIEINTPDWWPIEAPKERFIKPEHNLTLSPTEKTEQTQ